ncbi:MAG TPA: NAD kinase [Chitinophagaceae bacterium]|jgi:NAD+ kinase|nr:NAD kinase [Chitinophagaceae bacterium]OPZ17216.1 MAG: putative inorganic polyphosphate/ATP-NAD kinase [Bacteroidetes bacterium ADurb.BinA245]HMW67375.1 NAD kinase [Chitinophagaceae bacterium]HNA19749.1 NAD kinase [Chitinophagaceae bacterium]HNC37928.1 NAD kinase [Chitinophagaceae bacterium]
MKAAIYSRVMVDEQRNDIQSFFDELGHQQIIPVIHQHFFEEIKNIINLPADATTFTGADDLTDEVEFIISLGGDGTLLDTITLVRDKDIAIMGINFGRMGFLASIGRDELRVAVKAMVQRTYVVDKRSLIHLESSLPLFGHVPYALNDFSVHKRDVASMIKIHTYLNGEFLNTYWADGLIVATPTGSTGYSLSCNGPVVFPDSDSFVITPVAPHNLNVRPIVVPDSTIISFEIESRADQIICALDSRRQLVSKDVQLAIRREKFDVNLVRLSENNFLQTLRNKLTWGLDKRN